MSWAQELVRTAILKTNGVFPFSRLNRLPYWMAAESFAGCCRRLPEVRGVYLRHGMTGGNWVPGVSDIDLTVTISEGLSRREEFHVLSGLRAAHARLRRRYPMLVDLAILSADHLAAWSRFGVQGAEQRHWKVLFGGPPPCEQTGPMDPCDALDDALERFFERMLVWYLEPLGYVTMQRMRRVASRILRHCPFPWQDTNDPTLLVARVLLCLDRWIGAVEAPDPPPAPDSGEEPMLFLDGVCLAILPGADENEVRDQLFRLRQRMAGVYRLRPATFRIARYWLRTWNPYQRRDWLEEAHGAGNPGVLARIGPATEAACVRSVLHMTGLVLSFPQAENVLRPEGRAWFGSNRFASMVRKGLFLRLYLEKGIQHPRIQERMREAARHHPDFLARLAELQRRAVTEGFSLDDARFQAYCLLKDNAVAVNEALAAGGWIAVRDAAA